MHNGNINKYPAIEEYLSQSMECHNVEVFETSEFSFQGKIHLKSESSMDFKASFKVIDETRLSFKFEVPAAFGGRTNFLSVNYKSADDEEIYGMGLQYTVWNFKGQDVPLVSTEGGVGRGLQPLTKMAGIDGGNELSSYGPSASYITNKRRAFIFTSHHIGMASFKENTEMLFWHATNLDGFLISAPKPIDLARIISKTIGTMKPMPEWIQKGVVVGIVGGQKKVKEVVKYLKQVGVKLSGVWMQDWVGQHKFPEGTRLMWNWQLNPKQYPEWHEMIDEWAVDGIKPVIYCSPYIADLTQIGVDAGKLFVEGCEKGYFVKNSAGEPYLIKSVSIKFAMIDFTNPEAKQWCKHIIKDHLIKEARAGGWMHDFGEYMPFDAVLSDGSDPIMYHNKYVEEWARCGAEAVSEVENGKDLFYFMRAATTFSPRYTSLFWMGD